MAVEEQTDILVVDDLREKLLVYQSILDELGQNLVTARSGAEALKAVLERDFAVILLDVNMPGMDGFETAALIRRRRRSAHTPIIFLTAFADDVRAAEGYAHGAVDYIPTPVVPAVLRAKVRVFVDLYRMTQQVKRQAEERVALAAETTRRQAAEDANRWLDFQSRAGAVLGHSLDQAVTSRDVATLPIPLLADAVALVVPHAAGGPPAVTAARAGEGGPVVDEAAGWEALAPEVGAAVERVLAGHAPARAGADGVLALPLRARGRTLAALVFSRVPARAFTPNEVAIAESFASRAAVALDNAQLHRGLEEANRQKNEFLSMLAHELRNPLAPMRNAVQILNLRGGDDAQGRWARDVIDRQLTHMVRLVDDLLDVSRITQGKIRLKLAPTELGAVVAQAVEASRPLVDQFRHRLHVTTPDAPVWVNGDAVRLTQVFTNLLNNAAKYTEEGGTIAVALGREGDDAVVRIRDTGVGIPADMLATVFDLFTQANRSVDRAQGGLGIGLTLVRRLVEKHGGKVGAASEGPGRGSEFVVRLPVATAPPEAPRPADPPAAPPALRIVIVDDNVDGAESLADLLRLSGHEASVAVDGPAGIEEVRRARPDVVLLDIGLPGMDGYEVARRLRADPDTRGAVLIAVSGYGQEEDRRRAREAGFAHHCVKPVEFAELHRLLKSVHAAGRG